MFRLLRHPLICRTLSLTPIQCIWLSELNKVVEWEAHDVVHFASFDFNRFLFTNKKNFLVIQYFFFNSFIFFCRVSHVYGLYLNFSFLKVKKKNIFEAFEAWTIRKKMNEWGKKSEIVLVCDVSRKHNFFIYDFDNK